MKDFLDPELEVIKLNVLDVITTSDLEDGDDDLGWH